MVQAERMNRSHRVDAAIAYALERRWDFAAVENRGLLEEDPTDVESANRLGKALTELGDVTAAIEAYERAVNIDPTNAIARKNLVRLQEQKKAKRPSRPAPKAKAPAATSATGRPRRVDVATESLRTAPLIEDFGKSVDLTLARVNARAAAQVAAGDPGELEITASGVAVKTNGTLLGHIDPRTGLRLKRMIEGGNKYSVVVLRVSAGDVEVHVRETHKHHSLVGQASFLPQAGDLRRRRAASRAYTKSSVVQYDRTDDDEDYDTDDEDDVWRPRSTSGFDETPAEADEDDEDFTAEDDEPAGADEVDEVDEVDDEDDD
ncbi:MAG: tetratricopeptide repeat protein [Dehalococcoidia bacterium]|nr:tetratricopeptide repeat protein [Dehalococcoidia bacterium]